MSLNRNDINTLASVCRSLVQDLQNPVAIADQSTFLPAFADLTNVKKAIVSRAALAALVNRFFAEGQAGSLQGGDVRPNSGPTALSET